MKPGDADGRAPREAGRASSRGQQAALARARAEPCCSPQDDAPRGSRPLGDPLPDDRPEDGQPTPDPVLTQRVRAYYTERLAASAAPQVPNVTWQADPPAVPGTDTRTPPAAPGSDLAAPQAAPGSSSPAAPGPSPFAAHGTADAVPGFGCGQPTVLAELRAGETVLDLGSGAGLDAFRAAEAVGGEGRVIGVDMTPAMLERARAAAATLGFERVRFLEGTIEALPVADASIDVVISNCVVNLSQDKAAVFREAFRVLRAGGRLAISDVLRNGARTSPGSVEGWCACVDGAEPPERYRRLLRGSGFAEIAIDAPPEAVPAGGTYSAAVRARKPDVRSAGAADLPAAADLLRLCGLPTEGIDAPQTRLYVVDAPPPSAEGGSAAGTNAGVGTSPGVGTNSGLGTSIVRDEGATGAAANLPLALVGMELYGEDALLRSLAVRPDARARGYGEALLHHALREAAAHGARTAYGLTTTIPELLTRWGFAETRRRSLPATLNASLELQGACPADARAFVLRLA